MLLSLRPWVHAMIHYMLALFWLPRRVNMVVSERKLEEANESELERVVGVRGGAVSRHFPPPAPHI